MKLKNYVLFDKKFFASLQKLSVLDLDVCYSIPLAKTMREIKQEATVVFPIRDKIFEEFQVTTSNVDLLDPEKLNEFDKKIKDLLETEFEIPLLNKIVLDEKQIKGKISADDLLNLTDIVTY